MKELKMYSEGDSRTILLSFERKTSPESCKCQQLLGGGDRKEAWGPEKQYQRLKYRGRIVRILASIQRRNRNGEKEKSDFFLKTELREAGRLSKAALSVSAFHTGFGGFEELEYTIFLGDTCPPISLSFFSRESAFLKGDLLASS